jgi:hypothetical protein
LYAMFTKKFIVHQAPKFNGSEKMPSEVNWSKRLRVNEVKDMKVGRKCDSSYVFAVVDAVEAYYSKNKGKLLDLSVQELLDCDVMNGACGGGEETFTFNYMIEKGISLEKDYEYKAKRGECPESKPSPSPVKVYGFAGVKGPIQYKKVLDVHGPIIVEIKNPGKSFQFYDNGIFKDDACNGTENTVSVVLYGYGHDNTTKTDYWIVRNSWSKNWGENGYMRLEMGPNSCFNANKRGYYPLLDESASADNQTADLNQFGIGIVAMIAIAVCILCCCCCICFCICKWCIGLCCD